jgi:hypothetical protein
MRIDPLDNGRLNGERQTYVQTPLEAMNTRYMKLCPEAPA